MKKLTCLLQVLQISHHCISPNKTLSCNPRSYHLDKLCQRGPCIGKWHYPVEIERIIAWNQLNQCFLQLVWANYFYNFQIPGKRAIWEDSLLNYLLGWRRRFGRAIIQADYQCGWIWWCPVYVYVYLHMDTSYVYVRVNIQRNNIVDFEVSMATYSRLLYIHMYIINLPRIYSCTTLLLSYQTLIIFLPKKHIPPFLLAVSHNGLADGTVSRNLHII